jgi:hypothetical protein
MLKCHVKTPITLNISKESINCQMITSIKISINSDLLCFTIFSQSEEEPDDKYLVDYESRDFFDNYYPLVELRYPFQNEFTIFFLHSRYETVVDSSKWFFTTIEMKNGFKSRLIRYQKTIVNHMPKPYKSCHHHKNISYHSKADCMFKCKAQNYIKIFGQWPEDYFTNEINSTLLMGQKLNKSMNLYLKTKCEKICDQNIDCFNEYFSLSEKNGESNSQWQRIVIFAPATANTIIRESAKIQVEEFLCFIASIVSLWFGFSIFMLSNACIFVANYMNIILFKYKTKISNLRVKSLSIQMRVNSRR